MMDPLLGHGCASRPSKLVYPKLSRDMAAAMLSFNSPRQEKKQDDSDNTTDYDSDGLEITGKARFGKATKSSKKRIGFTDPSDYEPFEMPKFEDVHTTWPGFVHEPVPDWEWKYMIAKPYPRSIGQGQLSQSTLVQPTNSVNSVYIDAQADRANSNVSKSQSKQLKKKVSKGNRKSTGSISIQRNGSCIK